MLIARYDKDGQIIAVGDNCHDLARQLKITPQAVSHAIHRGSKLYAVIEEGGDKCKKKSKKNSQILSCQS